MASAQCAFNNLGRLGEVEPLNWLPHPSQRNVCELGVIGKLGSVNAHDLVDPHARSPVELSATRNDRISAAA